ncbi:hypothetical protein ACFX12_031008 [Malus domestica]
MILQSVSASFDFSQPPPLPPHCPCGNFAHPRKTHNLFSLPSSKRRRKQLLIAKFPRKSVRRKWGFSSCAVSPDAPGSSEHRAYEFSETGCKKLGDKALLQ